MNWKNYFTTNILERGLNYYNRGAVSNVQEIVGKYYAQVIGAVPYDVMLWVKPNKQLGMSCTCPYAQDGYRCKHMAALCYELNDVLKANGNKSNTAAAKKIRKREYPFIKKNTSEADEYTYFDLSVITSDVEIMSDQLEKARGLVESKSVILETFDTFYEESYYGIDYVARTNLSYKSKNRDYMIRMAFDQDKIRSFFCEAPECRNIGYYNYGYYGNTLVCPHGLAALLLISDYIDTYNPGDETDYDARIFLDNYLQQNRKKVMGEVVSGSEDVHLEPRFEWSGDDFTLSFRCGVDKMYVVKNLTELVKNIEKGKIQKFGTKTEIHMGVHKIHPDSREYYEFLKGLIREEKQKTEHSEAYDNEIRGSILMYGKRLDEIFDIVHNRQDSVLYSDSLHNIKNAKIKTREHVPHMEMKIYSSFSNNHTFKGISLVGNVPEVIKGEKYIYYMESDYLNRINSNDTQILEPLFDMAEESGEEFEVSIGRKALPAFYNQVMPMLSKYVDFEEVNAGEIEKYRPVKPEFSFYLDIDSDKIICDVKVKYGEKEEQLFDHLNQKNIAGKNYDLETESEVLFRMRRYFEQEDETRKLFVCENTEENAFRLLQSGIDDLLFLGEVLCTERLKQMKIRKKAKFSVGVTMESGLMNLDVSSEDISNKELLEILASYRKKKKYHRLKNGDFLNLEDDNLGMLAGIMDTLQIPTKEFLKGNMHVPAYRALYLDKLLEKNESLYVNRDKHFKSLIKEFKTVNESDFEIPEELNKIMRNYQVTGFKWLKTLESYGFGGILADDMGLGKTLQTISVLLSAKKEGKKGTSLIICPASLIYNWKEEFERYAKEVSVGVLSGNKAEREKLLEEYEEFDVLITSYDLLRRDVVLYEEKKFLFQVIDEAQYIKNHTTAVAKTVKSLHSEIRIALTGTPIENRLSELWSIFDYLMPGFLYGYETFRKEMETPIVKNKDEQCIERLKKMVAPFILRRLKQDVLKDLPDKLEEVHFARFESVQQQVYDAQVAHMKELLAKQDPDEYSKNKIQVLAELTKLRQICCDPNLIFENYNGESAKREACMDLIKSGIEGEHRMLLFSQFTSMLSLLEESLKKEGIPYYKITGSTSKEERMRLVTQFNEGDVPVFLISLKAGGTGLNLVGADVVIHYDPWWNQAVQNQATDRAHRIGQQKVVTVFKLIMKNTIEEKIVKLQETKKNLADEILNGENGSLGQLSKEDLLELLS